MVVVTMEDYRFKHPSNVPAGRVVFQVNNAGEVNHRLTLLPLAEEVPPIDEQLRDQIPQAVAPLAGVPEIEPGDSGTFAVELEADTRYAIVCFIEDDDGSHALKGESSEFRTSEQT